jgi:hypothetical protein
MVIYLPKSPFWLANLVFVPCLVHLGSNPLLPVEGAAALARQAGNNLNLDAHLAQTQYNGHKIGTVLTSACSNRIPRMLL